MFADKYLRSINTTNLKDDEFHHQTEALQAAAWSDRVARQIGSLMARVKYCDGPLADQLANNSPNLTQLAAAWLAIVTEKGKARNWVKIRAEWDITMAIRVYSNVATHSLQYYLDGKCDSCGGTGARQKDPTRSLLTTCPDCKGTGRGNLPPMSEYEKKLTLDMIGELEALESSHAGCASKLMRRDV